VTRLEISKDQSQVETLRIQHTINGRPFVIEVSEVGRDRWRAQIARQPGGSRALMPFYGTTPNEAADHLSGWLSRAGAQPAK
jgi:hypothetical protein